MIESKSILLGSVLKPVDDTRMYEKIGISLAENPNYRVSIFGFKSRQISVYDKITFYPLKSFPRISLKRYLARWKFFFLCIKVKPDLIIVNTHELLGLMVLYRILFGSKHIYDVQENYYLNIRYGNSFKRPLNRILANWVRFKEKMASSFIDHFLLAERSYLNELTFATKKATLIENRFRLLDAKQVGRSKKRVGIPNLKMIYTGTISVVYGIFETIEFFKEYHQRHSDSTLTIIGYCPLQRTLNHVLKDIEGHPGISLIGGNEPVPHPEILQNIADSDIAFIPYRTNRSIVNCFPTKIYEYHALKIPFFINKDLPWVDYCKEMQSCIPLNFSNPDWDSVEQMLQHYDFYGNPEIREKHWQDEENKLFQVVSSII